MTDQPAISPTPPAQPCMNYAQLRQEGVRLLQELCGGQWTDHNSHDPGITILETLCHALTDLGYRTQSALLAMDNAAPGEEVLPGWSMLTPEEILPCHPLTLTDLRELLLDFREVGDSASPARLRDVALSVDAAGRYTVRIEFEDDSLNRFLTEHKAEHEGGVIAGLPGSTPMTILDRLPDGSITTLKEGEFPFHVRADDADVELSFPSWSEQMGTYWTDTGSTLFRIEVGKADIDRDTGAGFVEFRAFFVSKEEPDVRSDDAFRDGRVAVRIIAGVDSATDLKAAMQLLLKREGHLIGQDDGSVSLFDIYKHRLERIFELRSQIAVHLAKARNLCEFFPVENIVPLSVLELSLFATVTIDAGTDEDEIVRQIYQRVRTGFNPQITPRSPWQKMLAGMDMPDAFTGPLLDHYEEVASADERPEDFKRQETLCASDVIRLIMDIPGVQAVVLDKLTLFPDEDAIEERTVFTPAGPDDTISIPSSERLRLSMLASRTRLSFCIMDSFGNSSPEASVATISLTSDTPEHAPERVAPSRTLSDGSFPWESMREHISIQEDLPANYGLKHVERPDEVRTFEREKVWQLRGYLALFDQLLASAFTQLAATPPLFLSTDPDKLRNSPDVVPSPGLATALEPGEQTLFIPANLTMRGIDQLLVTPDGLVRASTEDADTHEARASRLLDHLLARHGVDSDLADAQSKRELLKVLPRDERHRGKSASIYTQRPCAMHRRIVHLADIELDDLCILEPMEFIIEGGRQLDDQQIRSYAFRLIVVADKRLEASSLNALVQREAPAHLRVQMIWLGRDYLQKVLATQRRRQSSTDPETRQAEGDRLMQMLDLPFDGLPH